MVLATNYGWPCPQLRLRSESLCFERLALASPIEVRFTDHFAFGPHQRVLGNPRANAILGWRIECVSAVSRPGAIRSTPRQNCDGAFASPRIKTAHLWGGPESKGPPNGSGSTASFDLIGADQSHAPTQAGN